MFKTPTAATFALAIALPGVALAEMDANGDGAVTMSEFQEAYPDAEAGAFSALDTATRLAMQDLAARVLTGRTVLLITHDPLEALRLSDHAWLLGPDGAERLSLPDGPALRDVRAPGLLCAQAALLARLHRGVACAG